MNSSKNNIIMNLRAFVLDDEQIRLDQYRSLFVANKIDMISAMNAEEAKNILEQEQLDFDYICLDHDLSEVDKKTYRFGQGTGTEVASWLAGQYVQERDKSKNIVVHSANSWGATTMFQILSCAGWYTVIRPFAWTPHVFYKTFV